MKFCVVVAASALALIFPTTIVASPAHASAASTQASVDCLQEAEEIEASGEPGSFACVIQKEDDIPPAGMSSPLGTAAVGCYASTVRHIYGELGSRVEFAIIYGQRNDPVNGSWDNCVDGIVDLGLQTNSHLWGLRAYSRLANHKVRLSGSVTMEHFNGVLPSNTVDSVAYVSEGDFLAVSGWLGGTSNGIYAVKMGRMVIDDYGRAHTFRLNVDVATPRFLCQTRKQCRYPGGAEAPVFG